jgi:outer membrane lipoprotein SlyB
MSGTFSERIMNRNTRAAVGPFCAAIIAAVVMALTGCGAGDQLLRQSGDDLEIRRDDTVGQTGWQKRDQWQRSRPASGTRHAAKARRCDIQTGNHVTQYRCSPQ